MTDVSTELPGRVRGWVEGHAPDPVVGIEAVDGGITKTKWVVRLAHGDPLIVRWCDPQVWGETGSEHVRREAQACRLLSRSGLPMPHLVASDPKGLATGGAANLLAWLPGSTRLDRLGRVAISALADVAVALHRQRVTVEQQPPVFAFRGPAEPRVPDWARYPDLWRQAIEIWNQGAPATPYGLLHRDFHLGNILWQADTVTGLIDWAELSWGPADLDVAHMCSDFAMLHSTEDAVRFRDAYLSSGGQLDPNPEAARFWVISDILGFLPDPAHILPGLAYSRPDLTADRVRHGLEDLLAITLG